MRVWDNHPGYLNDQSLLGEHREIHAIYTVLSQGKKGYSRHPETLRWQNRLAALAMRHRMVVAEMLLRGFNHHSPMPGTGDADWPAYYIDEPAAQFAILRSKYQEKKKGRIPLPASFAEQLVQHRLSLLLREAGTAADEAELIAIMRRSPSQKGMRQITRTLALSVQPDSVILRRRVQELRQDEAFSQTTILSDILVWLLPE